jgi:hypothetical protein
VSGVGEAGSEPNAVGRPAIDRDVESSSHAQGGR